MPVPGLALALAPGLQLPLPLPLPLPLAPALALVLALTGLQPMPAQGAPTRSLAVVTCAGLRLSRCPSPPEGAGVGVGAVRKSANRTRNLRLRCGTPCGLLHLPTSSCLQTSQTCVAPLAVSPTSACCVTV